MLIFEIFYFSIKKELQLKKRNNLMNRMKGKKKFFRTIDFLFSPVARLTQVLFCCCW